MLKSKGLRLAIRYNHTFSSINTIGVNIVV
nr:MAG TPA: hypothetical protein [Bacteriophage sp.]